ncbi:MAG TPA: hypothetical protein VIT62_09985 [Lysobacter sp.]
MADSVGIDGEAGKVMHSRWAPLPSRLPGDWREQLEGLDVSAYLHDRFDSMAVVDRNGWARLPCPLGVDEHPILIHTGHGGFRCDQCHEHGDLLGLVQRLDGVTFPDAVRLLLAALQVHGNGS